MSQPHGRRLTKPPGASDYQHLYEDADSGPPLKKLATGATLAQLSEDYALFTYAPLILFSGLNVNPVQEWLNGMGLPGGVWLVPLSKPIVNLGESPAGRLWATKLWACEKTLWEGLRLHLANIAGVDRARRTFVRSLLQEMPVPDVVALGKLAAWPGVCPMVTISTFALDGNRATLAFEPAKMPPLDLPTLRRYHADPGIIRLAEAVFSGSERPYDAAE